MSIKIEDELKQDFLVYANEVNCNRAFPDTRDGLKPGMRAALYTMYRKGFTSNKPHVKSAKISGATIGELWPHGDGSVYEVLVRMSQPWVNNICEVDFHGANGSLLGGPDAASSRYTECRLSKASEEGLFSNIKKETVDMIPNFSEDDEWPLVLPAIFPRLFVNGSQGIGYTIAQEWEPGNLNEFLEKVKEYITTKKISYDNIYPDYPTGGVIINKSDIHNIYETGKGSVILRGKVDIINNFINITELPYQVYAEPFIQKIKDLVNSGALTGIEDICNKSGDEGLLIEIECSNNPQAVLNKLYKLTDLQVTFSANQMALVNGIPQMLNLKDYIKVYVDHNINCIVREYKYDLDKATARLEIVGGLIKAISIIDNVISTIKKAKSSETAKQDLITNYQFSESQAKAIIDMRLGKLANLEQVELKKEEAELNKIIDKCNKLLNSDKLQNKEFINRLSEFTDNYGWSRRTEVTDIDLDAEKAEAKQNTVESVDKYIICLTKNNTLRKIPSSNYKPNKSDDIICAVESDDKNRIILISDDGMMYKLDTKKIPACSQNAIGARMDTFFDTNIITIYNGLEATEHILMTTRQGLIKKIESKVVFELSKCVGAIIMKVENGDKIIDCRLVNDTDTITLNNGKKDKVIKVSDLIAKGRGAGGIVGIKVKDKLIIK